MSTSFITDLPLDQIEPHPHNVRHAAAADQELITSVATHGLLQALVAVPGSDGKYLLIAGHRRLDALRKAGIMTAPTQIRDDLTTEAQQIEAMLVENGRREDLSAIEEAEGYEQLELFGYKPKDIAKATGRNVKTVRDRLKLRTLSDSTRAKVHDGQVSISDALALADFADDPERLANLEELVGTHNFPWKLTEAKRARERAAKTAKEIDELVAAGVPEVTADNNRAEGPYPIDWLRQGLTRRDDHPECLAWRANGTWLQLVCTNPTSHDEEAPGIAAGHAADAAARQREFEERQAENQRQREAAEAAQTVRVEHARAALPVQPVDNRLASLIRVAAPAILSMVEDFGSAAAFVRTLGFAPQPWFDNEQRELVLRDISRNLSDGAIIRVLHALLLAAAEASLDRNDRLYDEDDAREAHAYLGWLQSTGYTFCDVDTEIANQVEQLLATDDDSTDEVAS